MSTSLLPKLEMENVWTKILTEPYTIDLTLNALELTLLGGLGVYHTDGQRFFSGLVPLIMKVTNAIVIDKRKQPTTPKPIPMFVDRYYQRHAVAAGVKQTRGVIKIPTGGGKTLVAAGILASLDCTWLYLVHKANLVEDAAKTFEKLLGEKVGRVHGNAEDISHRIVCATFKSLASRPHLLKLIQSVEGVLVDEAHTLPAKEAFSVVMSATNAFYRIGLGATPLFREDRRDLHTIALLGPEIYSISPQELAKNGFLVLPEVEWIDCAQRPKETDFDKVYSELIVNSNLRNNLLVTKLLKAPKPAIVFVKMLKHQDRVLEILRRSGVNSFTFVRGDTPIADRAHVVDRMRNGTLDVVVSSSVFNEGMDAPNLRTVINATGQSSWIATIQEPGRGTRPANGKNSFKMYDFNDVGNKWFEMHTAQRYAAYRAAGYNVSTPSLLATKVLDTLTERCNMLEPKAYSPVEQSNFAYYVGFALLLGLVALLQNC